MTLLLPAFVVFIFLELLLDLNLLGFPIPVVLPQVNNCYAHYDAPVYYNVETD